MGLHAIDRVFPGGGYGVDIFFVLSAFLITSLILEELEERSARYSFGAFYWRRVFRLAPALLLWLVAVASVTAVAMHQASLIPVSTAASLFYFGDFAGAAGLSMADGYIHVWSLAIEEQFYLVWPFLLVLVVTRTSINMQRRVLALGILGALALAFVSAREFRSSYFLPTRHLVCLTVGALAGHAFVTGAGYRSERILARSLVGPACLAVLAAAIFGHWSLGADSRPAFQLAVAVATGALLLHLCLRQNGRLAMTLASKPSVWTGKRSYGLYLYHRTFSLLIPALITGITLRYAVPLVLAISLLVAAVSYRFVERPVRRAGRAWLRRRETAVSTSPEAAVRVVQA